MRLKITRRAIAIGVSLVAATAALVGLDLWTKALAESRLAGRGTIPLLGDFAVLVYADNRGAFLSLGAGLPEPMRRLILIAMPIVAIPLVVWALLSRGIGGTKAEDAPARVGAVEYVAAVLVAAGGAGNLYDRIFRGEVRDFLNFGIGRLRTGIMNVADLYILFAIIAIASALIRRGSRDRRSGGGRGRAAGGAGPADPGTEGEP